MNIDIDGKNFEIKTIADFKRAGEELKRVNQFKIDLVKNKYARLEDRPGIAQEASRELEKIHHWHQSTLDKLWDIKHQLDRQNSKDTNMNYYEKIVEEKRNDSQVIERGTIKGVEYFIEKITETVKYPRPFEQVRYIGKLKKDGRVVNYTPRHERIDTCKRALEDLAEEYKSNSKEEKSNSVVTRGTIHGHKYEVERVDYLGQATYIGYVYDKDGNTILKTDIYMKAGACEQEIKSKIFNSKENWKVLDAEVMTYSDPDTHERYYKVWLVTDEGWRNPRVFKTFQEADREAARIQREVKSQNSKENSMNYYEKLIQEKKNASRRTETGKFELEGEAKRSFLVRMSSWIESQVASKLGKSRSDIELDTNSGLVTLWVDPRRNGGIKKKFYQVEPYAKKREIREDGDIFYMQEDFELKYVGEKY